MSFRAAVASLTMIPQGCVRGGYKMENLMMLEILEDCQEPLKMEKTTRYQAHHFYM